MAKRNSVYHGPNRVREFRKRAKLTLQKAAPLIGLSWAHLARIETGGRELNTIWMDRIGKVFGCSPADLLPLEMGGLSTVERDLVNLLRHLPEPNKRAIEAVLESQRPYMKNLESVNESHHWDGQLKL
jgi:DNA-binding XRE family transcriptional regulator